MEIAKAGFLSNSRLGQMLTSDLGRSNSNWSDHMTESESGSGPSTERTDEAEIRQSLCQQAKHVKLNSDLP